MTVACGAYHNLTWLLKTKDMDAEEQKGDNSFGLDFGIAENPVDSQ